MSAQVNGAALLLDLDPSALATALERSRVVGVIDAWLGQSIQHIAELTIALTRGEWILNLWKGTAIARTFYAASPDEARAAAAKAIESGEV